MSPSRRQVLSLTASASLAGLAGCADTIGQSNDELHLCRDMGESPIDFDSVSVARAGFIEGGFDEYDDGTEQYYTTLVSTENEAERFDYSNLPEDAASFARETSFDEHTLLVVQGPYGSSAQQVHMQTLTRVGDTVRAEGCLTFPDAQTDDLAPRAAIVRWSPETEDQSAQETAESPITAATVDLTVAEDREVTFSTGDGVVTRDPDQP
ncbi:MULTISPECIES: hypothetical protein [unclassified Haladaptatus]|uniref:hypothetical protein n=1 Tax=unclassified Haladaptatus TaxID=2622732 RepID=UPI0023E8053A|nr:MULTISPECIES: hypothetical protein [unclassified Haladaptatus]